MDIYPFIDSQAIREHLQKLDYGFCASEMAYLIWQSRKKTLEEKLRAWQELMETTADEEVFSDRRRGTKISLHQVLRKYVNTQKNRMEAFQDGKDCIYFYGYEEDSFYEYGEVSKGVPWQIRSERCFQDYKSCCEALGHEVEEYRNTGRERGLRDLWIERYDLDGASECDVAHVDAGIGITRLNCRIVTEKEDVEIDFEDICQEMCVDIPTPFCRGDLVYHCGHDDQKPFVLDYINTWNWEKRLENGFSEEEAEEGERERDLCFRSGDPSGMWTYGYEMRDGFGVWYEELGYEEYFNLEYYREPLEGKEQVLKLIGEYLKGKCCLELLLNGYAFFLLDGKDGQLRKRYYRSYREEDRKCLGLDSPDEKKEKHDERKYGLPGP